MGRFKKNVNMNINFHFSCDIDRNDVTPPTIIACMYADNKLEMSID